MDILLKEHADKKCHDEHYRYEPYAIALYRSLVSYHISHADSEEEDWHTTEEYLQMR